jgi:hypothetical protein
MFDKDSQKVISSSGQPLNDEAVLSYTDKLIRMLEKQKGGDVWASSVLIPARDSAKNLATTNNITAKQIKALRTMKPTQAELKSEATFLKILPRDLELIIKYY